MASMQRSLSRSSSLQSPRSPSSQAPFLSVSVTDPVKLGNGVQAYISYRVITKTNLPEYQGQEKIVIRRYSDFVWLHDRLFEKHKGIFIPPLPEKSAVEKFRFSAEFIEMRRQALDVFVNRIASHPELKQSEDLRIFLQEDEEIMERARFQETGFFKKKPADFMQIFKDVQTKVSDVVLGKEKPVEESNPEYEKLKRYIFDLEEHLAESQKQAFRLVKRHRELSESLSDFGKAIKLLGACEGNTLGKVFSDLGTKSELLSIKLQKEAHNLLMNFEEPLKDYVRAVQSIKATIAERANAFKLHYELAETTKLKEINLDKLMLIHSVMDEEARVVDDASISDGDDATSRGEVLVSVYVLDGDVSWLWKKKPFEKTVSSVDSERESVAASVVIQAGQDTTKEESYVRISVESYARLTELENQVKDLNRKLTSVHENLSSAQSEIKAKDIIVKQHEKVAEDAISGWEKAEAESLALSHQLESVTVLKLTAEEKVSHLDGALRECTKQMRKMKEDSEQKLQDVIFAKTKQWEKINADMQERIADFEQKLLRASSENAALSRSLQERSNMLLKITEEKSQADAEIELLRNNIQSCEKEISSFDYELNILSKELEIRNEEKNMIMRSAEVANKQHSEDVKKITKLEAECQRLRNLVRKKLPGPAALAQMKLEVENLGRDYGENRMRRGSNSQHILVPDFAFENIQQCYKENEFLTSRLLAMEEETKMLKEALTRKNSELQDSQNLSEKTMDKLQSIETHIIAFNQQKSPSKPTINLDIESESNPQSLTELSKDGIDEDRSYFESWVALLPSEASQLKKDKDKGTKGDQLELMDDFLEMERFACQSTETNGSVVISNDTQDKMETANDVAISIVSSQDNASGKERESDLEQPIYHTSCNEEPPASEFTSDKNDGPLLKLQSRIASIFESESPENDIIETLERIRCILQDTHEELPHHSESCIIEETQATICEQNHHDEASGDFTNSSVPLEIDIRVDSGTSIPLDQDFKNAISHIYDSIVSLGKIVLEIQDFTSDNHCLSKKIDEFSSSHDKVLCNELSLHEFILTLSCILSEATELVSSEESNRDIDASECIDKVTLLENEVDQHELTKDTSLGTSSSSGLEIEEVIGQDIEMKNELRLYSMEEFEQLKVEKENLLADLDCQTKLLDETKQKFVEIEVELTELKFKLTASEKSNSLAETQLKCMAESYKSLELRTQEMELQKQELENEINVLRTNVESLKNELQEERHNHQIDLAKYDILQEKIIREGKPSLCPFPQDTDVGIKTKQEKELAATAEKLAECQETIFLLGRQLKAMHSSEEPMSFSLNNKRQMSDFTLGNEPSSSLILKGNSGSQNLYHDNTENTTNPVNRRIGGETPLEIYNYQLSPSYSEVGLFPRSPINSERQKHRLSEFSSSTLSTTSSEKHGRGISRFFSIGRKE